MITAGCLGGTPEETTDANYPPGVSENGIQNLSHLYDAHFRELRGGFSENSTVYTRRKNGITTRTSIKRIDDDGNIYALRIQSADGVKKTVEKIWRRNASSTIYLVNTRIHETYNSTQYGLGGPEAIRFKNYSVLTRRQLSRSLDGANQTIERVEYRGSKLWRIRLNSSDTTLFVEESGLIREFRDVDSSDTLTLVWTVRIKKIGDLKEPSWTRTVENRTNIKEFLKKRLNSSNSTETRNSNSTDSSG
ncbi:MAG: hypothetical protein SV760_03950 [Halobacteria archaeon]|nr:hypothetical protein [Halobacteria archaeon]